MGAGFATRHVLKTKEVVENMTSRFVTIAASAGKELTHESARRRTLHAAAYARKNPPPEKAPAVGATSIQTD